MTMVGGYALKHGVGEGSFGKVVAGTLDPGGNRPPLSVAVKMMPALTRTEEREAFDRVMCPECHENYIKLQAEAAEEQAKKEGTEIEVVDAKVWSRVVTVVVDEDDEAAVAAKAREAEPREALSRTTTASGCCEPSRPDRSPAARACARALS